MSSPKDVSYFKDPKNGYLGSSTVLRAGVKLNWSEAEISEYIKCQDDPIYFIKNYCKVIHLDHGLVNFNLRDYQERMINLFHSSTYTICLCPRQIGKSTTSAAYLLWYCLFNPDKAAAVLANKRSAALEVLSRVTLMLENLPFFLQSGCKELNKGSISWENNSKVFSSATTGSSIRGKSINLLFLDEFSHVTNDVEFFTSTYPVISSGKSAKVIITSTPNGTGNMFHKLWEGSVQGTNGFKWFLINWWDVPGRDEAWKNNEIANTSELQFRQEHCNEFLGSSNTLISGDSLMGLKASTPIHMEEDKCMSIYAYPHQDHKYIGVVDVSKGRGQDYSVFHMIDITANPMKVVATYRNNNISPLLYPQVLEKYGTLYNNALMVIESNDAGCQVASDLYYDLEYENTYVESRTKAGAIGLTMTSRVKRMGCSNLKDLIEGGKLSVSDKNTIIELSVFAAKGDSYAATKGNHDDCVMPLVLFAYFIGTKDFADETNISLKDILYKNTQTEEDEDEDEPTFAGFMNNDNGGPTRQVIGNDVWS